MFAQILGVKFGEVVDDGLQLLHGAGLHQVRGDVLEYVVPPEYIGGILPLLKAAAVRPDDEDVLVGNELDVYLVALARVHLLYEEDLASEESGCRSG